ncbi:hypothetical protein BC937DRAFT_93300 [Endogone sp. FLAS-F59071]|nr:hypothetical protein BC937DRAFT_93300 [Endogone sp. FLAS-F59071]|eukprot:RUS14802.1 hypothetical protein BC937DRAFT_93300 [Endogone sp. FLAS-F59071]
MSKIFTSTRRSRSPLALVPSNIPSKISKPKRRNKRHNKKNINLAALGNDGELADMKNKNRKEILDDDNDEGHASDGLLEEIDYIGSNKSYIIHNYDYLHNKILKLIGLQAGSILIKYSQQYPQYFQMTQIHKNLQQNGLSYKQMYEIDILILAKAGILLSRHQYRLCQVLESGDDKIKMQLMKGLGTKVIEDLNNSNIIEESTIEYLNDTEYEMKKTNIKFQNKLSDIEEIWPTLFLAKLLIALWEPRIVDADKIIQYTLCTIDVLYVFNDIIAIANNRNWNDLIFILMSLFNLKVLGCMVQHEDIVGRYVIEYEDFAILLW